MKPKVNFYLFDFTKTVFFLRRTVLIVFLLSYIPILNAQNTKGDEYFEKLNHFKNLNKDSSIYYAEKAIEWAKNNHQPKFEVKVISLLGDMFYIFNEAEKAFSYNTQALEICENNNLLEEKIELYYSLGLHYSRSARRGNDVVEESKFQKALEYHKKGIDIAESLNLPILISKGYNLSGVCLYRLNKYDQALEYYRISEDYSRKANDSIGLGYTLDYAGSLLSEMGKLEEAEEMLFEALNIRAALNDSLAYAINLINIGELYLFQNKKNEAISYFELSNEVAFRNNFQDIGIYSTDFLSDIYEESHQFERAYFMKKRELMLKDSMYSAKRIEAIEEMETKYETELKEKELLKTKNKLAEEEVLALQRLNYIYISGGGAILILLMSILFIQRSRRIEKEKRNQLKLKEQEKATQSIIKAQEAERRRIAQELHDGIGQQLGGLKLSLHKLKNNAPPDVFENVSQILDQTSDEVREISHQMMPKSLIKFGLKEAIQDVLEQTLKPSGIHYEFDCFGMEERLDPTIEVTLFRIVQELIINITKHAEASEVQIQLMNNNNGIMLRVEDNGKGMNSIAGDGIGLTNVKTRLDMIGGVLHTESQIGEGTTFTIKI